MNNNTLALLRAYSNNLRSFSLLKEMIEKEKIDIHQLRNFAHILQPHQLGEKGDKPRLSRNFFDEYGNFIAGPCGCSHLILDHRKAKVTNRHAFLSLTTALYGTGWIDCSMTDLVHIVECGFQTGYKYNTIRNKIREGSRLSDTFSAFFNEPKVENLADASRKSL